MGPGCRNCRAPSPRTRSLLSRKGQRGGYLSIFSVPLLLWLLGSMSFQGLCKHAAHIWVKSLEASLRTVHVRNTRCFQDSMFGILLGTIWVTLACGLGFDFFISHLETFWTSSLGYGKDQGNYKNLVSCRLGVL